MHEQNEVIVFGFPGQGAPYGELLKPLLDKDTVGLDSAEIATEVVEEIHEATRVNVADLVDQKTSDELADTRTAHILLLAAGVAGARILLKHDIKPNFVRGHSAAAYTAAVVGGALALKKAAKVVRARGITMHEAAILNPGSMTVVSEIEESRLEAICANVGAFLANFNSPLQTVIGGPLKALDKAREEIKREGGRATPFRNWRAGAAHTPLVEMVQERLSVMLKKVDTPTTAISKNIDGQITEDSEEVRIDLISAARPIRWSQGTEVLIDRGMTTHIEIGPSGKKVLSGLLNEHKNAVYVQAKHIASILSLQKD